MFEIGQKVVPIDKTVEGYDSLEESIIWKKALENGTPYLCFRGKDDESDDFYLCNVEGENYGGDFFHLSDLVPYVEDEKCEVKEAINILNNIINKKKIEIKKIDESINKLLEII